MKRIIYILIFANILLISKAFGQQLPYDNQYLINKFSLSPAYAGYTENIELFLTYRQNWVGVPGAPQKQLISVNMPITNKNLGLGFLINNEKTGNFSNFYFLPNIAYHQKLGADMSVNFGVTAELYRNQYNFSQAISQTVDPIVQDLEALIGTTFNVGAGLMFQFKGLNIGVSVPRTLNSKVIYNEEIPENTFTLSRHYIAHISYFQEIKKKWKIEPIVVVRSTEKSPLLYEASVLGKFDDRLWVAIGYRKGNDFVISTGAALTKNIVLNYSYEFSSQGIVNYSSGTHEISLGFLIKKTENKTPPPTIFRLAEEDEKPQIDPLIEAKVKKLEIQLEACMCEEKDDKITDLDNRLKKLEGSIDQLDAESWEKPFIMKNIKFGTNSSRLFASSFPELKKLSDKMKRDPELMIKIIGYTDSNGSKKYNLKLSSDRAKSVKAYLVKEGVEPNRVETEGKGPESPIESNETPAGRAQNRRIEGQFKKQ